MRAPSLALALLLATGCGKRELPPPLPKSDVPAPSEVDEPVEAPTQPTAAFAPTDNGACARAYRLVEGTCVHRLYEAGNELAFNAALSAYKRGAAPPMLGAAALARAPARPTQRSGPGSLMRKSSNLADAGSSKDQRLAELDAMLALARAKLQKRDEEAKAKQVANAPRARTAAQSASGDRAELDRFAQGLGAAGGASGSAAPSSDPAAARMSELSRLTGQLSGEQLEALTSELGKSGFNPDALEAILAEAQDAPKPH